MRAFGAILVIGASTVLGVLVAENYRQRPRLLGRFAAAIELLRSQIGFGLMPLPRAFETVGDMTAGVVSDIFREASSILQSGEGLTGGEAWEAAIGRKLPELPFDSDELALLRDIGRPLGLSDREDQEKHLALAAESLRARMARIEEAATRSARLWVYLGISGGAILVLLLL